MSNNVFPDPINVNVKAQEAFQTTAFGELLVAQAEPLVQFTAQHGLRGSTVQANIGGSVTEVDSNFVISTGTGANNVAALVSAAQASYRSGQGLMSRYSAIFTQGVADNTQIAGMINSELALGFGFNGVDYGVIFARDGVLEYQKLQITVAATGSENATITIDNVPYSVPITNATVEQNAYEIATYLNDQPGGYDYESTGDTVNVLAKLPDLGAGTFSFSSASAVGVFTEVGSGTLPVETWIKKADWNVNPDINIDPTKGNVYQIQLQYLGYGGIQFYVENPETARFELVHIIKYASTSTRPTFRNPVFRVGWASRNTGNASDVVIKGASGAIFTEGAVTYTGEKSGFGITQTGIGTTLTNILTLRNNRIYNDIPNRDNIILKSMTIATDTGKTARFSIVQDPVVASGDYLDFVSASDIADVATNQATIIGGNTIAIFNVKAGQVVENSLEIASPVRPGSVVCIASQVSSGAASEMDASLSWQDDL